MSEILEIAARVRGETASVDVLALCEHIMGSVTVSNATAGPVENQHHSVTSDCQVCAARRRSNADRVKRHREGRRKQHSPQVSAREVADGPC